MPIRILNEVTETDEGYREINRILYAIYEEFCTWVTAREAVREDCERIL